jgi:membrane associated rhomboid family serine protease
MEITYVLMAVIGLVTYVAWQKPELHSKLMLNPYSVVQEGQYYRLITSGFVHNSMIHLGLNMLTLYFLGQAIEFFFSQEFGSAGGALYVLFFLSAIVVANVPTTMKYKESPHYNSLGASGGVSALLLAFILKDPLVDLNLYLIIPVPGYLLGVGFVLYSIVMSKKSVDHINHDAHLFGALYGMIFIMALRPDTMNKFLEAIF